MATTTYSTKLRLAIPTTGELADTWGSLINTGLTALVDDAIAGIATVSHPDTASYTLTANNAASDEARCAVLKITGALTAARNVVCPTQPKLYIMENATTGGFAVTLKTAAGTGVSVPNGTSALLRCDGTNVIDWIPVTGTGSAVYATSPTLVTPALGTPSAVVLTNATGTAASLTAGVANGLKSATTTVAVSAATAPTTGQVLTATSSTAAAWQTASSGPATGLLSATTTVAVSAATAPTSGQVLMATSGVAASWQAVTATGLASATTTVAVSAATAPTVGQVLTATSSTAATWQTATGAPLDSPAFTGNFSLAGTSSAVAPTAAAGTNTTQIATTAFVTGAVGGYAADAIGTYAFANYSGGAGSIAHGSTVAGSLLTPVEIQTGGTIGTNGTPLSGTWRCMGYGHTAASSLYLRIS